jgi:hypothetical protein
MLRKMLSRERSAPVDEVPYAPVDERARLVRGRARGVLARLPGYEFEHMNNNQFKYISIHQELGLQTRFRKKRACIRKIYTVYGFLNSALVHHQPSPSTPVLFSSRRNAPARFGHCA